MPITPASSERKMRPLVAAPGSHASSMCPRVTPPARPPLPASPRRPRHPQIPPSTKASPTTTCRSKIVYALEHGQETAAAYLPAGEEAVPPTGGFAAGFVVRIELSSIRRPHEAGYLLPPLSSDDPCAAAATESTPGATRNET